MNKSALTLGIDASNIISGGGITHLSEFLRSADPYKYGFHRVLIWGRKATLDQLDDSAWLEKVNPPLLERGQVFRLWWRFFSLGKLARKASCAILYVPGGGYGGSFRPYTTMCRNMLPFEWNEAKRFGWSFLTIRYLLLRLSQSFDFKRANGVIFLTNYAKDKVMKVIRQTYGPTVVIPHGISPDFHKMPKTQFPIELFSRDKTFNMVYVSIVNVYKHQWNVVEAVSMLRGKGYPVTLKLIGPSHKGSLEKLNGVISDLDPNSEFVTYAGSLPHSEISKIYEVSDLCIFASSCENMPNILIEGMASGLPMACSNRGPMPEVLGDRGAYFDPEDPETIARALESLIQSPTLRADVAKKSHTRALDLSWAKCSDNTLKFLSSIEHTFGKQ